MIENNIYNSDYYKQYDTSLGKIDYEKSNDIKDFLKSVALHIKEEFNPSTVLDAGCAMGYLVEALRDIGIEAYGVDVSRYAIEHVREDIKPYCAVGSISAPLPSSFPKHFDLVVTIEVLEHMYAEEGEKAIQNLCKITSTVLFSSSPDGYEEPTHVNVQKREYWASIFASNSFYDQIMCQPKYISTHAMVFQKSTNIIRQIEDYEHVIRQTSDNIKRLDLDNKKLLEELSSSRDVILNYTTEIEKNRQEIALLNNQNNLLNKNLIKCEEQNKALHLELAESQRSLSIIVNSKRFRFINKILSIFKKDYKY